MNNETKHKTVYEIVTQGIIEDLEAGNVPIWRKNWKGIMPMNAITLRPYRGFNRLYLTWAAFRRGYEYPVFLTMNQAKKAQGSIDKQTAEYFTPVLWKFFKKQSEVKNADGSTEVKEETIPYMRYFTVYNISEFMAGKETLEKVMKKIRTAVNEQANERKGNIDEFISSTGININENCTDEAFYSPSYDAISIPKIELFENTNAYYETLFHELVHATGHKDRLNRKGGVKGGEAYSREELVAEIGASFLCAMYGVERTERNDTAYIQSWLASLNGNERDITTAAQQAQKAVDYLTGYKYEASDDSE